MSWRTVNASGFFSLEENYINKNHCEYYLFLYRTVETSDIQSINQIFLSNSYDEALAKFEEVKDTDPHKTAVI